MGWLCSIQHQTVIKMGWEFRPRCARFGFSAMRRGLLWEPSSGLVFQGLVLPGPAAQDLHIPGAEAAGPTGASEVRAAAVEVSGCQGAPRPRGGRPAPAWNVFIGIREPPASPPLVQAIAERHLSIFCQASWPLIAEFIWFKAASGEAGREKSFVGHWVAQITSYVPAAPEHPPAAAVEPRERRPLGASW